MGEGRRGERGGEGVGGVVRVEGEMVWGGGRKGARREGWGGEETHEKGIDLWVCPAGGG